MAWELTGVAVSEVTRYLSEHPKGTLSTEVTIDLQDGEPGPGSRITINVDLQDTGELTFAEVETKSLLVALDVIKAASAFKGEELDRTFRAKFVAHSEESPAG